MKTSHEWRIVKTLQGQYLTVWKVARRRNGKIETGFFKFTKSKYYRHIGPLLANELICNRLAKLLGLPVAQTLVTRINGQLGVLSLVKHRRKVRTWNQVLRSHSNVRERIDKPKLLYKTFVFDVWVCNVDRSGKNIIVYPKGNKYGFYLIDHELALLGAVRYEGRRWNSAYWDDVIRYTNGYNPVLLSLGADYGQLIPFVRQIQEIRPTTIRRVLDSVPSRLMSRRDKVLIEKILLRRRLRLPQILSSCARPHSLKANRVPRR